MPEPESPRVRSDRLSVVAAVTLVSLAWCLSFLVVFDWQSGSEGSGRRWLTPSACAAVGVLASLLFWSPYRVIGLIPFAAVGWLVAGILGVFVESPGRWSGWAHWLPAGLITGAVAVAYRRGHLRPRTSSDNLPLCLAVCVGPVFAAVAFWMTAIGNLWPPDVAGYLVLGCVAALAVWSWARLFRPAFELACEPVLWLMYSVRGRGPGLTDFPRTGPCLVIANHACWFDPLFLAKVLPRPITPMMTARFYDLPVIRRLMRLFGVIRVPEKAIKKDTPEIRQAIAALDRGECVVVFPEGYLRRADDRPLRRFGQGIWQVLQTRPDTPVFACWIEGGWGSYASYSNGPPTKNKRPDFRRPIAVGVSAGVTVPPEALAEHLTTRVHLMNLVSEARTHLGLPPLPPFELPERDDEAEGHGKAAPGSGPDPGGQSPV